MGTELKMLEGLQNNIDVVKTLQDKVSPAAIVIRQHLTERKDQMDSFSTGDKAAFAKLDPNFTLSADGETAVLTDIESVEITRHGDQLWLRFKFPGEPLDVKTLRVQ